MSCSARPRASPPTSTSPRSTAAPASSSAVTRSMTRAARSVASAGDVNGDGFADLIVGAHGRPRRQLFRRELRVCGERPRHRGNRTGTRRVADARRRDRRHRCRAGGTIGSLRHGASQRPAPATRPASGRRPTATSGRPVLRGERHLVDLESPAATDRLDAPCSIRHRHRQFPPTSIFRRSTAQPASGSAARRQATTAASLSPQPATSTAIASPT